MDIRKVRAVLFDLDGTLLDTIRDIGACVNDVMRRYGYPERDVEEYKELVGHGARVLIETSVPEGTPEEQIAEIWQTYREHYRENFARYTRYYPGVREFLTDLAGKGYLLGVITNKTQATAERILAKYFPEIAFSLLWGNNGKRPLKPALETALLACRELEVAPEEVAFVGDGDTDMEFASKAGFYACGVTWGYRPRQVLLDCGADVLADSFEELRALFPGEKKG